MSYNHEIFHQKAVLNFKTKKYIFTYDAKKDTYKAVRPNSVTKIEFFANSRPFTFKSIFKDIYTNFKYNILSHFFRSLHNITAINRSWNNVTHGTVLQNHGNQVYKSGIFQFDHYTIFMEIIVRDLLGYFSISTIRNFFFFFLIKTTNYITKEQPLEEHHINHSHH